MYNLTIKKLTILLIFLMIYSGADAQEQIPKVIPTISRETHKKLVEVMFPLDELDSPKNEFVIVLRYNPSFESNQQIIIAGRDGKIFVTESIAGGNLWYKANKFFERTGREDPTEIAQEIGLKKREFNIPANLEQRWRVNLIDSVAEALRSEKLIVKPTNSVSIISDGTDYEMWYSSKTGKLHYFEYGSEVSKRIFPDESAFIRWMKLIRLEIGKRN